MRNNCFSLKNSFLILLMLISLSAFSQFDKKSERLSLPENLSGKVDGIQVNIIYSSPAAKGRKVFGELVPFGKLWRTGANEASIIEFSEDVMINGQILKKGKYAFYSIPRSSDWVLIFNKEYDQWGEFNYDKRMDALRIKVHPVQSEFRENMEFTIDENGEISLYWEETKVPFKLSKLP